MARSFQQIQALAEGQWGLITKRQAEEAGVGWTSLNRMVESGRLERIERGVYRVRGAAEPDHMALRAAWLSLDPGTPAWERLDDADVALVSYASAADLYGVGELRADVHEFTMPTRRQSRREDIRIHRGSVDKSDRLMLHGLPTTRAGRMVADLLADHIDPTAVAQIIDEVLRHVYDYPSVVAEKISPFAARFGLKNGDGLSLLDHMLRLSGSNQRGVMMELAGSKSW